MTGSKGMIREARRLDPHQDFRTGSMTAGVCAAAAAGTPPRGHDDKNEKEFRL